MVVAVMAMLGSLAGIFAFCVRKTVSLGIVQLQLIDMHDCDGCIFVGEHDIIFNALQ